jgi:hypothetical protein
MAEWFALRLLAAARSSYLLGEISDEGFWLYFPIAFAVKTPLATIVLLLLSLMIFLSDERQRKDTIISVRSDSCDFQCGCRCTHEYWLAAYLGDLSFHFRMAWGDRFESLGSWNRMEEKFSYHSWGLVGSIIYQDIS